MAQWLYKRVSSFSGNMEICTKIFKESLIIQVICKPSWRNIYVYKKGKRKQYRKKKQEGKKKGKRKTEGKERRKRERGRERMGGRIGQTLMQRVYSTAANFLGVWNYVKSFLRCHHVTLILSHGGLGASHAFYIFFTWVTTERCYKSSRDEATP